MTTGILSGDIRLMASQRLTDTPDGGGRVTGHEIVSGEHNSVFPDISDLDRAYGVVNLRKVFLAVQTDDTATYYGANATVLLPPADPNVGLCLMSSKDHHDTRTEARDLLERYLARGPKWRGFLYDTQLQGQRAIRFFQRVEVRLPEIGETLVLVGNEGKAGEFEQYVRVLDVGQQLAKFQIPGVPEFTRNVVTCTLADPLRYTFEGEQPTPYDVVTNPKTALRETVVADAANYFATTKLAEDAHFGALQVKAKTIFTQLVPAARSETPAVDLTAAGELASLVDSGKGQVSFSTVASIAPSRGLFLGTGALPGTVSITIGAALITDRGGSLVVGGSVIGSIDYGRGQCEFNAQCPNYGTQSKTVSFWPAARPARIADTASIEIKANNRGYAFTNTLHPTPAPGSLTISFMAQGKWYDLKDNGRGELLGQDSSYGSGLLNFATGSVLLTLGALPDVDTSIMFSWATPVNYTNRSGQPISIGKSAWQLPHTGITPKSLILTWGTDKTANDSVGDGKIRGDITGIINYAEGIIDLEHITLPALGQEYVAQYQYGEPVTEHHVEPGRLSTPGMVGHLSITLDGTDGGGAHNLTPGSLRVKFNALYHTFDVDDQELVIQTRDPIITLQDDGLGKLRDASGNELGAIDYAAGTLHFMPDGSAPLPKPTYAWVTVGTRWEGNQQLAVQRWTMTGIQYHNTAYTFPDGQQGWVDVTYRNNNSAQAQNATLTAQALRIDVTPGFAEAILEGSLRFTLGGSTYVDRQGLIYRNPDPETGAGIQAGTIDYSNGVAVLADWSAGQTAQPQLHSLATSFSAQSVDAVTFRTPGAPLAPGSLYISANTASGRRIEATADGDGYFTTLDMDGRVDYQTGIVSVRFGQLILAAGHEAEPWYDENNVIEVQTGPDTRVGKIWRPVSVVADTIRFSCVVFSYLPLDADLIGLDPVRLPSDGRVPFIRKGNIVVVHSTQRSAFPMGVTAGQQLNTRQRLAYAHVEDKNGKQLAPALYSVNLDSGIVTLASPLNLTGYVEPLVAVHRIEDMSLVSDVEISGRLVLARPLSHDYDAADTLVSSALIMGDLWSRYTGLFDQRVWTNTWSDFLIGDPCTAQYNDTAYPLLVTNRATLQERWAIIFQSSTSFVLVGEHVGQIAVGDINSDFAPLNPNSDQPYFFIDKRGWGAGWASGNVLRFTTQAASYPMWEIRTTLQSVAVMESDRFELQLRGNVNR